MKKKLVTLLLLVITSMFFIQFAWKSSDDDFVTYTANAQDINLYWKDKDDSRYGSLQNFISKSSQRGYEVVFAMNGGMYKKDKSPQGLFIENGNKIAEIDTASGGGNFYLKPNGVFYLTNKNEVKVSTTKTFLNNKDIKFATQSGPMLIIDGEIHSAFKKGSVNLNIRNGVGILSNGQVLFVMSKKEINFYDFAEFFKNKGCKNALYLDGFVSRTYCPSQNWAQTDGDFGVIIAVVKKNK